MATEQVTTPQLWDELHADPKHDLRYPSEHVVRWLAGLNHRPGSMALDIGCGHGRHMRLLEEFGYVSMGVDTTWMQGVVQGSMTDLPLRDEVFDVALSYGVFYYGSYEDYLKAVAEMWRVLRPGGQGLVVTRSTMDSRRTKGLPPDELGMRMTFLREHEIPVVFGLFTDVAYEWTATTKQDRQWLDADWVIRVTK